MINEVVAIMNKNISHERAMCAACNLEPQQFMHAPPDLNN
jgi:hypothetical protein